MSKETKPAGQDFGMATASSVELLFKRGVVVTAVKVKYPGIDPLLIVTARTTEGPKVCFVGGHDLDQVGRTFHRKVLAESLEWREDTFLLGKLDKPE